MKPEKISYPEMRTARGILIVLSLVCLSGLVLVSCDRNRTMRGYDFIPDMAYSRAYETYSENPNFTDSMTMRVPAGNSVPRGFLPFRYTIDPEQRVKAGKELINPYQPTEEVISRGKFIFTTFCIGCHGSRGKGDGYLYSSGLYPLKPRDLTAEVARQLKDGEIFHTITLGFGSMGAHGSQVKPDDRWKLVKYIRRLQQEATTAQDSVAKIKP